MIRFTSKLLVSFFLFTQIPFSQLAFAEDNGWKVTAEADIALARKYSKMMSNNQVKQAMKLVADNVIFADYTWGDDSEIVGKDKLYQAYSSGSNGLHNVLVDERLMFAGRGTVVFHYIFSADSDLGENTKPASRLHGMMDMVQVLTIKNGKIVRHLDFADYDRVMPMLQAKIKAVSKN